MRVLKLFTLLIVVLCSHSIIAQGYEYDVERGEHWKHVINEYGQHWYGWQDEDGNWHWQDDPGTPWPPDIDYGDGDSNDGYDYGDDWWDEEWEDDRDNANEDYWNDFWRDPWENWEWDDTNAGGNVPPCPSLEHNTLKSPNRNRLRIAIGEEVELRIKNSCGANVNWTIQGNGVLTSSGVGPSATFQATYEGGTVTAIANLTGACVECGTNIVLTVQFDVITPESVFLELDNFVNGAPGRTHEQYRVSAGMVAKTYIMPDDVNFYNVTFQEDNVMPTINGPYFVPADMVPHIPANPVQASDIVFPNKGTRLPNQDIISSYNYCRLSPGIPNSRDASLRGSYKYDITQYYLNQSGGNIWQAFDILEQDFHNIISDNIPANNSRNLIRKRSSISGVEVLEFFSLQDPSTAINLAPPLGCN